MLYNPETKASSLRATCSAAALIAALGTSAGVAHADISNLTPGSEPTVTASEAIAERQNQTSDLEAIISGSSVVNNVTTANATLTGTGDSNAFSVTLDANLVTSNAIDLSGVSSSGAITGAAIAQVQDNTGNAFAQITGTDVDVDVSAPDANSTVSAIGNVLSSDLDMNQSNNLIQGTLNPAFDSTNEGSGAILAGAGGVDGGLVIGSAQTNTTVGNATTNVGAATSFSTVDDDSSVTADVSTSMGAGLTLNVDSNLVEAQFAGNNADNLIDVQAGGDTTLSSSAGILSRQTNTNVGDGDNAAADLTTANVSGSVVTATVDTGVSAFDSSTLSLQDNTVQAVSVGSLGENDVAIAAGVNVDQDASQNQVNAYTESIGALTSTGGLFVASIQESTDSDVISTVNNTGATTFQGTVNNVTTDSTITVDDNDVLARATVNQASSSIDVAGASTIDTVVTSTNVQDVTGTGATESLLVTATATDAGTAVRVGDDTNGEDVTGSTVMVTGNDVQAVATANASTTFDDVTGTAVPTIGLTASDITDTGGSFSSPSIASLSAAGADNVTAGISALSVQEVTGSAANPVNIFATTTDAITSIDVSSAGATVTDNTFTLSNNRQTAQATANTETMAVDINAANTLDASSAIALAQDVTEAEAQASTSGSVTATVNADGAATTGNTIVVGDADLSNGAFEGNLLSATATAQSGATNLSVDVGGTMTVSSVIDGATDSLNLDVTNSLASIAVAETTVLTDQRITNTSAQAADADVTLGGITATVNNDAEAATTSTVAVDGNAVMATADGNVVSNTLSLDAASIDMSTADDNTGTPQAAGTNLATLGSVQEISGGGANIFADITAGTGDDIAASISGTGDNTDLTISADGNMVMADGAGNTAVNRFSGSGTTLVVTDTGATTIGLQGGAAADNDLDIAEATIATGVLQSGAQDVTVSAGTLTEQLTITADTSSTGTVQGVTMSVDDNSVTASGVANTATTVSSLDYTGALDATSAVAVRQNQTGDVGVDTGATARPVQFDVSAASATVTSSTLSASGNVADAQATGNTAVTQLSASSGAGIADGGTGVGSVVLESGNSTAGAFDVTVSSDFALANQQLGTGSVDAFTAAQVVASTSNLTNSTLTADNNEVTAGALGIAADNDMSLTADADITAASGVIASEQDLSGAVTATVNAGGGNIGFSVATGVQSGSTVSLSSNLSEAEAIGVDVANVLSSSAGTGMTGDDAAALDISQAGRGTDGTNLISADGARVIASDQIVGAAVTANNLTDEDIRVAVAGTADGGTIAVDSNTISAEATGATASSRANGGVTSAGTTLTASTAVISVQETTAAGDISADVDDARMTISVTGNIGSTTAQTVSLTSNDVDASATGLTSNNIVLTEAATIDGAATEDVDITRATGTSTINNDGFASVANLQETAGTVSATITEDAGTASRLLISVGTVDRSTVALDQNTVTASALGINASNTVQQSASGSIADGSAANIGSVQVVTDTVGATVTGLGFDIATGSVGANASSTLSADGNQALASATGAAVVNSISNSANGSFTGDGQSAISINDGALDSDGDADIVSAQALGGAVTATLESGVDGGGAADDFPSVTMEISGTVGSGSTLTLDDNSLAARAVGLTGSNVNSVSADGALTEVNAAVLSEQAITAATTSVVDGAAVDMTVTGAMVGTGSITGNDITSSATAGTVSNSLTASAAEISGDGVSTAMTASATGPITLGSGADSDPEFAIASSQTNTSNVSATVVDADSAAAGDIGIQASFAAVTGVIGIDDNSIVAQARSLEATNTLNVSADNGMTNASAVIASIQNSGGDLIATLNDGSADRMTIGSTVGGNLSGVSSLDGNTASAALLGNLSVNSLNASAGGTLSVGTEATMGAAASVLTATTSGLTVMNSQTQSGDGTASVENADILTSVTGQTTGTVSVDGNTLSADARSNYAANSAISVDAGNSLTASASLGNLQSSAGNLTSLVDGDSADATSGVIGLNQTGPLNGTASVSGNRITANATQNQAFNSMVLNASTFGTVAGGGSATAGTTGTGDFVALNSQSNTGGASATVSEYRIGMVTAAGGAGLDAGFTGTAQVDNNVVLASAAGNMASNSFTLDAAGNNRGDFVSSNIQSNTGPIIASISAVQIGLNTTGASGVASLDGNRIAATSQGNVSSTRIGGLSASFTNR